MRIYHFLSGQLLQTISVKLENSPFLKLYVDFSSNSNAYVMFLYVLLAACVLMFAQELLRFRYVRHIPVRVSSSCQLVSSLSPPGLRMQHWAQLCRGGEKFSEFFPR